MYEHRSTVSHTRLPETRKTVAGKHTRNTRGRGPAATLPTRGLAGACMWHMSMYPIVHTLPARACA